MTPFAAINDKAGRVTVVLDAAMMAHDVLNFHPLVNTGTTTISREGLLKFLEATGHRPRIEAVSAAAGLNGRDCIRRHSSHLIRRIGEIAARAGPKGKAYQGDVAASANRRRRRPRQGHDDADLRQGRHRGIEAPAGAGRLLGALVRPLQAADAGPGEGGARRQGQGEARQDEYRRASRPFPAKWASNRSRP